MKRRGFDEASDQKAAPERSPSACWANDCPMRASVSLDGGRFVCSCHAFADASKWPTITHELQQNSWLIGLISDCQRLHQQGKTADARALAVKFWTDYDAYMVPSMYEVQHFPLYLLRLRGELAFRVGASQHRPAPRHAAAPLPHSMRGNLPLPEVEPA